MYFKMVEMEIYRENRPRSCFQVVLPMVSLRKNNYFFLDRGIDFPGSISIDTSACIPNGK